MPLGGNAHLYQGLRNVFLFTVDMETIRSEKERLSHTPHSPNCFGALRGQSKDRVLATRPGLHTIGAMPPLR